MIERIYYFLDEMKIRLLTFCAKIAGKIIRVFIR